VEQGGADADRDGVAGRHVGDGGRRHDRHALGVHLAGGGEQPGDGLDDDVVARLVGEIAFAASTLEEDRLGANLVRIGLINRAQFEAAMRAAQEPGRRLGQALIDEGVLNPEQLAAAVTGQVERIVFSVFDNGGEILYRLEPDAVLKEMWENPKRGYEPVLVKAFINLIGVYPVGTVVILDTYELAIVQSANPNLEFVHRPVVRIVSDPAGTIAYPGFEVDLASCNADGNYLRSIIKVTTPEKYGIRVSDYFV